MEFFSSRQILNFLFIIGIVVLAGFQLVHSNQPSHKQQQHLNAVQERNKKIVMDFYQSLFGDKNLNAIDRYIDDKTYTQHNPSIGDGKRAFKEAATSWFSSSSSASKRERVDIRRIATEKDLVWFHVKSGSNAIVEIFRLSPRGKIVEHWDVVQSIPNSAVNSHPMF